jgi:uncharacterized membrane protein YphA (DoxX/SURF4 family)
MSARDTLALSIAPIFLRIAVGLTFLWAGLGKVFDTVVIPPAGAAYLETLGVKPETPAPMPTDELKPAETIPTLKPAPPAAKRVEEGAVTLPRMYSLSILLNNASGPVKRSDGTEATPIWPQWAASGKWPVYLARAVAVTEIIAGLFVLAGLLTRLSALSLAGVMFGAIWLTELGPTMQSGTAILGFIPNRPPYAIDAWRALAWQLSLLMACMCLSFLGGGTLSFDRALFPRSAPKPKSSGGGPRPPV